MAYQRKDAADGCCAFGAPGALAGMYMFCHKTKHMKFRIGLPVMLAVQLILLLVLK